MHVLRAAGSIRANSPKMKNLRLSRRIFIYARDIPFYIMRGIFLSFFARDISFGSFSVEVRSGF